MNIKKSIENLSKFEKILWMVSVVMVGGSYLLARQEGIMTIFASLIGVTALIFLSKGDVLGQVLTIVFSLFYGLISLKFRYYGEIITYLGMTAPIALLSVITWLRHPYTDREVKIGEITKKQFIVLSIITCMITAVLGMLLARLGTTNIEFSILSIATSFLASSLMMLRSHYYAVAYAANDIVLIILWTLASMENLMYLPMVICFLVFFINDVYAFVNWRKMKEQQATLVLCTEEN